MSQRADSYRHEISADTKPSSSLRLGPAIAARLTVTDAATCADESGSRCRRSAVRAYWVGLSVTDTDLVASLLKALPGKAFCPPCLAIMMGEPIDAIHALTKRLRTEDGFTRKVAGCSGCEQQGAVFGYSLRR